MQVHVIRILEIFHLVFDEIKNLEILIVFLVLSPSPPKLCHVLNSLAGYIVLHNLTRRKQCTDVSSSWYYGKHRDENCQYLDMSLFGS